MDRIAQEIKHFSEHKHIWWGIKTEAGQKRYDNKALLFAKYCLPQAKEKVLEIGCGDGEFTKRVAEIGANVIATDITPEVLARAKSDVNFDNVRFKRENCEQLSFKEETFEIVCGVSILHHVDLNRALREAHRVLKKGGRLFFTEPNLLNPIILFASNNSWLRKKMEFTPRELALFRWDVEKALKHIGFHKIIVKNYDFLYPKTPKLLIKVVEKLSLLLGKIPIIKEISGSILIYAVK